MAFATYTNSIHTAICKECNASKQSVSVAALDKWMLNHVCAGTR